MKRTNEITSAQMETNVDDTTDLSILRKPIKTSLCGLNEARKAYENGTEEVRQLLANECDIIYECKVCRNIFRSLVNFISHKRIYCKNTFNSSVHFNFNNDGRSGYNQDLATIVQAEKDFITVSKSFRSQEKDLSSIVERLAKREKANQMLKLSDFYEQVSSKLTQDEIMQKKHVLELDAVPDSKVAVYQTIKTNSCDSIKTEITEINELMDNEKTVLGPDGKILLSSLGDDMENRNLFQCEICKSQFATQKTLKLHIETKHIPSTYVYQCPSCSKTFLQVKAVIRHLTNDHKKSMKRVRLMRDSILKRRTRIDEVQIKGPSRELARLQTFQERVDAQNKAWLENLENIDASIPVNVCTFCGKRFDRRVVLLSHSKVCQQKYRPTETVSITKKANEEDDNHPVNLETCGAALLDESSNSNSMDTDLSQNSTVNKRKRNRAVRANINEKPFGPDDDYELTDSIEGSNAAEASIDEFDSENNINTTTWNIIDPETKLNICTIKEIKNEDSALVPKSSSNDENPRGKETSSSICKYCDKNFSNPSNLRRHITMLHVRQRKFSCLLCTKFKALRRSDVIQHLNTAHNFAGKKISVAEYISVKEDEIQESSPIQNRRKDKHIAVLKDDEVQVILEPDNMETNKNSSILDTTCNSRNAQSVEGSAEKTDEDSNTLSQNNSIKRKGRPKNIADRRLSQKIERSISADTSITRRPVRNRIMPVKKDFVYDLSNLLKKEAALYTTIKEHNPQEESLERQKSAVTRSRNASPCHIAEKQHLKKRRNTIQGNTTEVVKENGTDVIKASDETNSSDVIVTNTVKGAADVMATLAVNNNRAIFAKAPKLPTEHSLSTTIKHRSLRVVETIAIQNWPIIKRPMRAGIKSKPLKSNATLNSLRHTPRRKKDSSSTERQLTTANCNIAVNDNVFRTDCVDDTMHDDLQEKVIKISSKIADKIQMKYAEDLGDKLKEIESENNSNKDAESNTKFDDALPPKRRMTLLERLAENKTKKMKESMSIKKNISKTGIDSDENSD